MKRWAAVVLLAGAIFVVLAIFPQLRKGARVSQGDLIGVWVIDGDATWESLRKNPAIAQELKGLTPEYDQQAMSIYLAEAAPSSLQFTTDKAIRIRNGARHENRYTITASDGNVFTASCTTEQGEAYRSMITITSGQLKVIESTLPNMVMYFKRAP